MIREEILISNFIPSAAPAATAVASTGGSSPYKWLLLIAAIILVLWFVFAVFKKPANPQTQVG